MYKTETLCYTVEIGIALSINYTSKKIKQDKEYRRSRWKKQNAFIFRTCQILNGYKIWKQKQQAYWYLEA